MAKHGQSKSNLFTSVMVAAAAPAGAFLAFGGAAYAQTPAPAADAAAPTTLEAVIVSASAFPEARSRIASTIQVISQEAIQASGAKSLTDLLAENAGGFLSEWSAAQTSINIRGGASDGQGRDYLSDVLVLINGRRAGTANISKLSQKDVERIEIIRGPASVIYGSQNVGGVINIILKTGRTANGGAAEIGAGSFNLIQGHVEDGGRASNLNWYLGLTEGAQGDYHSGDGGGVQLNTAWHRLGATGAVGADFGNNRLDLEIRSDGCYACGFRGGQGSIYNRDYRSNHSIELTYSGHTNSRVLTWSSHPYAVMDEDDFNWASPVIVSNNAPVAGTSLDDNRRTEQILGNQARLEAQLIKGNTLLVGWDTEYSQLRSRRFRLPVPGFTTTQVAPYDNNQHEYVNGFYAEEAQSLLGDRLTLRGGLRYTTGRTSLDATPNLTGVILRSAPYNTTTYSAGASFKATDYWLFHFSAGSGYRAPSATQIAGAFTAVGGGRTFGNPSLKPETSHQLELGSTLSLGAWNLDAALFQNKITQRITTQAIPNVANTSQYINSTGDVVVDGVELNGSVDALRLMSRTQSRWLWQLNANGYWNFDMVDHGANPLANTTTLPRSYRYELNIGSRFGQTGVPHDWSVSVSGVLRGPVWINPVSGPEYLLIGAQEFNSNYYIQKVPFWVVNLQGEVALTDKLELSAVVKNLLNLNQDPIFFGLNKAPYLDDQRFLNGGYPGNSMIGRNFEVRLKYRF